jgi:hypothetical protein
MVANDILKINSVRSFAVLLAAIALMVLGALGALWISASGHTNANSAPAAHAQAFPQGPADRNAAQPAPSESAPTPVQPDDRLESGKPR